MRRASGFDVQPIVTSDCWLCVLVGIAVVVTAVVLMIFGPRRELWEHPARRVSAIAGARDDREEGP
jgi:hypothetical protein